MFRRFAIITAASLALTIAMAIPSSAQDRDHDRDNNNGAYNDNNYNTNSDAYKKGMREGQDDRNRGNQREHRHAWKNDRDAQDYAAGYQAGYGSAYGNGVGWAGRHHDDDDRRANGQWNNGNGAYGNAGRQAEQIGYQDGISDGGKDRSTGHSFRPTHDDNYKSASRGYTSNFGDKQTYKNTYRQGYERGYQEGYNGQR